MRTRIVVALAVMLILVALPVLRAAERGTPAEAEALVKKAVAFVKANGKDKALAEFSNPKGQFVDRDLYIFVYDLKGKCLGHGANAKMIGMDLVEMKDPDGKEYVKERIQIATTKGKGWQDYKFSNPTTKKLEQKTSYLEKVDDFIVGSGAYK